MKKKIKTRRWRILQLIKLFKKTHDPIMNIYFYTAPICFSVNGNNPIIGKKIITDRTCWVHIVHRTYRIAAMIKTQTDK